MAVRVVILGLSITSSWGNGHATTYRALVKAMVARGHDVLFLERDMPWYATNRDLPNPPYGRTALYGTLDELEAHFSMPVKAADLLIVGSYVPDGVIVSQWALDSARGVTAFYDIDTPVTVAALEQRTCTYLSTALVGRYDLYLSFTGGPMLARLERQFGARRARSFPCAVDPDLYYPEPSSHTWDLGYLGTYSADRQPGLQRLLIAPALALPERRFTVVGPQYASDIVWPPNVERLDHLPPSEHRAFYARQRFTLNVTRADMVAAGYSPSVRLFEAAACATPIISDSWPGLEDYFEPGTEILVAHSSDEVIWNMRELPEADRVAIARRARERVLATHTAGHRAATLEVLVREAAGDDYPL